MPWTFFDTTGSIKAAEFARVPLVATLPSSPTDGDLVVFQTTAMATDGVAWQLRYSNSAAAWQFIGGNPWFAEVETAETTTSSGFTDLATAGPTVTVPLSGTYRIRFGATTNMTVSDGVSRFLHVAVKLGAAATSQTDAIEGTTATSTAAHQQKGEARIMERTVSASDDLKLQYRTSGATVQFRDRWIEVVPVEVS